MLLCLKELAMTKDQVVPLNSGGTAARFESLLSNKVPAAILDPPYTTMVAKEGYRLLVDLGSPECAYLRNIAVAEKSLREDSHLVARFVAALGDCMQFYRNPAVRDEAMRILAKYLRLPLDKNRAMIDEGYETYRDMLLKKTLRGCRFDETSLGDHFEVQSQGKKA